MAFNMFKQLVKILIATGPHEVRSIFDDFYYWTERSKFIKYFTYIFIGQYIVQIMRLIVRQSIQTAGEI